MKMRLIKPVLLASSILAASASYALTLEQETTILQQLGAAPDVQKYQTTFRSYPNDTLELLELMLSSENDNANLALRTAFEERPELAVEIVALAKRLYLDPNMIVNTAILAGIDPTTIAQPTASGDNPDSAFKFASTSSPSSTPASLSTTPTNLATGSNGGGGLQVISPN